MGKRKMTGKACKWLLAVLLALPPLGVIGQGEASAEEAGSVVNRFDPDVFTGWGLWAGDGSTVTKETADGVEGKAVRINYDRSPLGWGLVAHADMPGDWRLANIRTIQFYAKGDGTDQRFSIGVEEKDGGDKFRKIVTIGGREWTLVTIPAAELEFQDGGGDHVLDWDKVSSLNISPEDNRSGYLLLDDITFGTFDPSLMNGFEPDVFADWGLWAGDGSTVVKSEAEGYAGKGLRFDYTRSEQGWGLVAHGSIPNGWNPAGTESLRFMIRGDGVEKHLSIGVEEKDGGDKFRKIIVVSGNDWTPVTLSASELEYQDGGGNRELDWELVNAINISPEENGSGYWQLDEFSFYKGGLLPPVVEEPDLVVSELKTGKAGSVFTSGHISMNANLNNVGPSETTSTLLHYAVKNDSGETVLSGSVDVPPIPAGGSMVNEISFDVTSYGYYTVETVLGGEGGASSVRELSFAYIADPVMDGKFGGKGRDNETLIGFSTHYDFLPNDALREQEAELIRLSGSELARNDFLWDKIEPQKGTYDWSLYDDIVETNSERGVQMIGLLAYTAKWASTGAAGVEMPEHFPPRTVSEYADFVYKTVSR